MANRILESLRRNISANLGNPKSGVYGWLVKRRMEKANSHLETNAVERCNIKPDYRVLEVGFGPGLGLQAAHQIVKKGKGTVYGIDRSFYMVDTVRKRLKRGVADKKVVLFHGSASNLPLNTDSIDRVYHCNCYYFWPSMRLVMRELYRVMKPGSLMVTTISFDNLRYAHSRGFLTESQTDPIKYMTCLENYGFENVRLEYGSDKATGRPFQAIMAEIGEKPAHSLDMISDDEDSDLDTDTTKHLQETDNGVHILK